MVPVINKRDVSVVIVGLVKPAQNIVSLLKELVEYLSRHRISCERLWMLYSVATIE